MQVDVDEVSPGVRSFGTMKPGEMGVLLTGRTAGEVVLMTYRGVVSLDEPSRTYGPVDCGHSVRLLRAGAKVTLTVL